MSNAMDELKLIAEIRKRPALWDFQSEEHRSCLSLAEVWQDLAVSMGSDVDTCQQNWKSLWRVYGKTVKRIEYRIKHDQLQGTYDPKNNYVSPWPFFEAMKFIKDIQTVPIKLSNSSDTLKFIAEMRNRPALWDFPSEEPICHLSLQKLWEDLAVTMGSDVENCKSKWKTLRNAYLEEAKKMELRIEEDKLKGSYDSNNDYGSKWVYFEPMQIIEDIKRPRPIKIYNSPSNDNTNDDDDSEQQSQFHYVDNIKLEFDDDMDTEVFVHNEANNEEEFIDEDITESQTYSEQETEKKQPVRRKDKPTSTSGRCSKRSYDEADIEKEEQTKIKFARLDITPSKDMIYVGDSDYNFLISFLPQMKKMTALQNLQFRAKMTDIMLTIMSQSVANDTVTVSSSENINSKNCS